MTTPIDHMAMARKTIAFARSVLSVEYADKAGREAYLAGFQAALALILKTTADYGAEQPVSVDNAERAIGEAERLIDVVAAALGCQ